MKTEYFPAWSWSLEVVRQSYAAVATSSFTGNRWVETGVYFVDEDIFTHYPWKEWLQTYLPDHRSLSDENIYLISSGDENNPPDGDIRCH